MYYYPADDEEFDVPVEKVPAVSGGIFGVEFIVRNAALGDCMFLLVQHPAVVQPGCPPISAEKRRVKQALWYSYDYSDGIRDFGPWEGYFDPFFYGGAEGACPRVLF